MIDEAPDDFQDIAQIKIQPGTNNVPKSFNFPVCSSATSNDGFIPYGETISDIAVTAHKNDDTDATADIIVSSSFSAFTSTVFIKYPGAGKEGIYHLTFIVSFSGGASDEEADYNRIIVEDT